MTVGVRTPYLEKIVVEKWWYLLEVIFSGNDIKISQKITNILTELFIFYKNSAKFLKILNKLLYPNQEKLATTTIHTQNF